MTQTNTDYLFQVTAPSADRTYSAANTSGGSGFDNLLSQASTSSGDDSRSGSRLVRSDVGRNDSSDRSWRDDTPKLGGNDHASGTTPTPPPARQDDSSDTASNSSDSVPDARRESRDDDKSDDTTSAEAAGAGQVSSGRPQKSDEKSGEHSNGKLDATSKTEVSDKAAANTAELEAQAAADKQALDKGAQSDAADEHAVDAAELTAKAAADSAAAKEANQKPQAENVDTNQKQSAKAAAAGAKSKAAQANKCGAAGDETNAKASVSGEASPETGQTITDPTQIDAAAAAVKAKQSAAAVDDKSDDDSSPTARSDTQNGAKTEQAAQAVKVDAAQLAASLPSATGTTTSVTKAKGEEAGAKPITAATGESVTAAFARMARANDTSANGSGTATNDTPQIDPSRFIGRVAKAFQTAQDRGGTVQLRLSPPELGVLRIELNVKDGVMSASLQAESSSARKLLLDHLPALRDRLAEQNIRVDRFDVDVRQDGSDGQANARGSQQQQFQQQSDQQAPRRQMQPPAPLNTIAVTQRVAAAPTVSDTGLNLII